MTIAQQVPSAQVLTQLGAGVALLLLLIFLAALLSHRRMVASEKRAAAQTALDVQNARLAENVRLLERRAEFDGLFADILTELTGCDAEGVDAVISQALQRFTSFVGVDYSFVLLLDPGGGTWSVTHSWHVPDAPSLLALTRRVPIEAAGWVAESLLGDGVVRLDSLDAFPAEATADREFHRSLGVESILEVPMKGRGGAIVGAIGLLARRAGVEWLEDDVRLARLLGSAIANTLERQRAEGAQREAREEWERTFDAAEDGIAIIDRDMRIRRLNEAMARRFDRTKEDCVGALCPLIGECKLEPDTTCPHIAAIRDGMPHSAEVIDEHSGRAYYVTASPLTDAHGDLAGTVYIARDVTRRKRTDAHVMELAEEVAVSQMSTIFALAKLAESRDDETGGHIERVQELCRTLAEELRTDTAYSDRIDDMFVNYLFSTAPLHDVGKVGVPDAMLLKPGRLTPEESEIIKTHTTIGAQTLSAVRERHPNNEFIKMGVDVARSHHERWDGTGYPDGLAGEEIPLAARIMAVADVYEALRSVRTYKDAVPHVETMRIIVEGSGTQFDPAVVAAFRRVARRFETIWSDVR